jgi:hypothetical protein
MPAFQHTKREFERARGEHGRAREDQERAQAEFKRAKSEFDRSDAAFRARLAVVRVERQKRKDDKRSLAQRAGVPFQYLDDLYVSTEPDGTVNIYFGGLGSPEGPGHGHYVMDAYGNVTYARDPTDDHGAHNFADFAERQRLRVSTWEPRASEPPDVGIIAGTPGGLDHMVSFKTGGPTGDQTLIANGDYSDDKDGFDEHHNHYGSKREGGWIDEDRGHYTGPDH